MYSENDINYTHTHHTHNIYIGIYCLYMIIWYLPSYHILSKSLGHSGGALCLSHWCDLLLGFEQRRPVGRPHGWRPGGNPKDRQGLQRSCGFNGFFLMFFIFYFFSTIGTPWDLGPCRMGFLESFFRWNCFFWTAEAGREMKIAEM